jgi:anti-anti-sigma factor
MPPSFDIAIVQSDGTLRLKLAGELDIATAPLLQAALDEAGTADAERILVDIAGVPFIDSSGLKVLLRASACGRLVIARAGPQARRLFALSGTAERLALLD